MTRGSREAELRALAEFADEDDSSIFQAELFQTIDSDRTPDWCRNQSCRNWLGDSSVRMQAMSCGDSADLPADAETRKLLRGVEEKAALSDEKEAQNQGIRPEITIKVENSAKSLLTITIEIAA